jgi:hypothetical protein
MSERRDDTTEPGERDDARPAPERAPRNYYYDDGTGYEVYDPAEDEDEPDGVDAEEAADGGDTEEATDGGGAEPRRAEEARLPAPRRG